MPQLTLWGARPSDGPVSPVPIDGALEIDAGEALWSEHNASFKTLAERFLRV